MHGAKLGRNALLGNGSTMLDDTSLGEGSMIAAGSLVTPGTQIPDGWLASGAPCKPKKEIAGTSAQFWVDANPVYYPQMAQRHRAGIQPID